MKKPLSNESEHRRKSHSHLTISKTSPVNLTFVDNRASTAIQRQLIAEIEDSPRSIAQRELSDQIHNSQRINAQLQEVSAISGSVVQQLESEEELLQGKSKPSQTKLPLVNNNGIQMKYTNEVIQNLVNSNQNHQYILQLKGLKVGVLNVVGENHEESKPRRTLEKRFVHQEAETDRYWQEGEFKERNYSIFKDGYNDRRAPADPFQLRLEWSYERVAFASRKLAETWYTNTLPRDFSKKMKATSRELKLLLASITVWGQADLSSPAYMGMDPDFKAACRAGTPLVQELYRTFNGIYIAIMDTNEKQVTERTKAICSAIGDYDLAFEFGIKTTKELTGDWKAKSMARSTSMHLASNRRYDQNGVWKVGDSHAKDMKDLDNRKYNLVSKAEFNSELAAWLKRGGDQRYDEPKDHSIEMPLEVSRYQMGF